jgi:hypothetical protein
MIKLVTNNGFGSSSASVAVASGSEPSWIKLLLEALQNKHQIG